ncbi:MAG: tyrosine--tRNA ligase [Proteobacteria bacterium]|nr:tyrosine--tRNA ligase [Pseudomonadota bacterium]
MTAVRSEFLKIMQERGFLHQCTDLEGLDKLLCTEIVTAYCGVDPTGDSLHVGHMIPYLMMRWFQKCGHEPIVLIGGVTGMIGDPTGKDESRQMLTEKTIQHNANSISKLFHKLLLFKDSPEAVGKNTPLATTVNNADWLRSLNYIDFLRDHGKHFSINRMLAMESVKQRLEREQSLSFLEFNYMILQGYDFLELYRTKKCRLQMAGSDQWGNIIQGVELTRRIEQVELFGLTAPLLTLSSGKKMGKTESGAVWLDADKLSPYDFYQFWRNTEDSDVGRFLRIFTELPIFEIEKLEKLKGSEINEAKKVLAYEVTKLCHGETNAVRARLAARETFEEGMASRSLPTITLPRAKLAAGIPAFALFKDAGLAASGGEARRLIAGGGARINDEKVSDEQQMISIAHLSSDKTIKLSAGKKKHVLVTIIE